MTKPEQFSKGSSVSVVGSPHDGTEITLQSTQLFVCHRCGKRIASDPLLVDVRVPVYSFSVNNAAFCPGSRFITGKRQPFHIKCVPSAQARKPWRVAPVRTEEGPWVRPSQYEHAPEAPGRTRDWMGDEYIVPAEFRKHAESVRMVEEAAR